MEIIETTLNEFAVVEVKGRINSTTAEELQQRLCSIARAGHAGLVVDFKHVAYMSSAGFRALLLAARAGTGSGCELALCGVPGEIRRLFDISGFDETFTMLATREECMARIRSRKSSGAPE